jgi:hypothetical protein
VQDETHSELSPVYAEIDARARAQMSHTDALATNVGAPDKGKSAPEKLAKPVATAAPDDSSSAMFNTIQ